MIDSVGGYEVIRAAEVDAIITDIGEPLLARAGFTRAARRKWVRAHPPIRHLFELIAMKGLSFVPRWAISLDFVPYAKTGGLGWHRTDRSAVGDLIYDPVDFDREWQRHWSISSFRGPGRLGPRPDAERVLPAAVRAAQDWFEGAADIQGARAKAEWLNTVERPGRGFGPDNYVQQRLAYAFLLVRTGAADRARVELDRWIKRSPDEREPLRAKLFTLLET